MCGILGTVIHSGADDLRGVLLRGLRAVEYRGYDSAGVAVLGADGMAVTKRAGKLSVLESYLGENPLCGTVGMGHTRWATHGEPNDANSHPHMDFRGRVAVVHNGIIENYAELKSELKAQGVTFSSDTDTEVIANLLGVLYEGDLPTAVR